jgi:hypothetical protein
MVVLRIRLSSEKLNIHEKEGLPYGQEHADVKLGKQRQGREK